MSVARTIRPVSYEETVGNFRIVNDAVGMGTALMRHCQPEEPTFQAAALAVLKLSKGEIDPEEARDAFIEALEAVGVFCKRRSLKGPRRLDAYPDRLLDCEEAKEDDLTALIGRASVAGWSRPETLAALISLCENTQLGDDADPILSELIRRGAGGRRS